MAEVVIGVMTRTVLNPTQSG